MSERSDLFWQLFDALGYVAGMREIADVEFFMLIAPDGDEYAATTTELFHEALMATVPDWPTDTGAALELCLGIGIPKLIYPLVVPHPNGTYRAGFIRPTAQGFWGKQQAFDSDVIEVVEGTTPAEALARLALAALTK